MQISLVAIAIVLLLAGVVNVNFEDKVENEPGEQKVLASVSTTPPTSTPTSTPSPSPNENTDSSYVYPGATILSQTENILELETTESVDLVTSWYKKVIADAGYNIKNFVQTKTNGESLNILKGDGEGSVEVQIEGKTGTNTSISVSY